MSLPTPPSIPLPRWAADAVRIVLFVVVYVALTHDFGRYEDEVETWVTLASLLVGGVVVRQSVTPVSDPRP